MPCILVTHTMLSGSASKLVHCNCCGCMVCRLLDASFVSGQGCLPAPAVSQEGMH